MCTVRQTSGAHKGNDHRGTMDCWSCLPTVQLLAGWLLNGPLALREARFTKPYIGIHLIIEEDACFNLRALCFPPSAWLFWKPFSCPCFDLQICHVNPGIHLGTYKGTPSYCSFILFFFQFMFGSLTRCFWGTLCANRVTKIHPVVHWQLVPFSTLTAQQLDYSVPSPFYQQFGKI